MTRTVFLVAATLAALPCARTYADVVISEIMYHPASLDGADEFLEVFNSGPAPVSLSGWSLDGVGLQFADGTEIAAGGRLVLARDASRFEETYGFAPDLEYSGKLSNGGETLSLLDPSGAAVDTVTYDDSPPWAVLPDGEGPSVELIDPAASRDTPRNWRACVAPAGHTAGAPNSVAANGLPPWVGGVTHTREPAPFEPITVSARVEDAADALLLYRIDFGEEIALPFADAGGGVHGATVPGQPAGTLVRFRIEASGATGVGRHPRDDDTVRYAGTAVVEAVPDTRLPVLHWYMHPDDMERALAHRFTDETEPAVLYYDGVLHTGVRVRVRGGTSRAHPKNNWKVIFPQGHDFDGGGLVAEPVDRMNLQGEWSDSTYARDILAWESMAAAGVPSLQAFPVRVHMNGRFFGLFVYLEQPDSTWVERQGLDEDAARYKAYSNAQAVEIAEALVPLYEKKGRRDEDHTDLHEFLTALNDADDARRSDVLFDSVDIPAVVNYLAVQCVIHNNDHLAANYYLYRDTEGTGRWTMHPWDLDLTFGRIANGELSNQIWWNRDVVGPKELSPSHPLFGDRSHRKVNRVWNRFIDALFAEPLVREMYLRRLRTLTERLLSPGRVEARLEELAASYAEEARLDVAAWGSPAGRVGLAEGVREIVDLFLPGRRTHLLETHTATGLVPAAQSAHPRVLINEIMFDAPGGDDAEFVELYNPSVDEAVDLGGWTLDGIDLEVPPGTVVPASGHVLFVHDDETVRATHGSGLFVAGEYGGDLSDAGETLVLRNAAGEVVDQVAYGAGGPWPDGNDGASLERVALRNDPESPLSWAAGADGGSPGRPNTGLLVPLGIPDLVDPADPPPLLPHDAVPAGSARVTLHFEPAGGSARARRLRFSRRRGGALRVSRRFWRRVLRLAADAHVVTVSSRSSGSAPAVVLHSFSLTPPLAPAAVAPGDGADLAAAKTAEFSADPGGNTTLVFEFAAHPLFESVVRRVRRVRGLRGVADRLPLRRRAWKSLTRRLDRAGARGRAHWRVRGRDAAGRWSTSAPRAFDYPR